MTVDVTAVRVSMDGQTFELSVPTDALTNQDKDALAARDTLVRRLLATWNPATAEAQLSWSTSPTGGPLVTVTREAKTKGGSADALYPPLQFLLSAPQQVPEGLVLGLTLGALKSTGQLTGSVLLSLQGRIQQASEQAERGAEYGAHVHECLLRARAQPSPIEPLGF